MIEVQGLALESLRCRRAKIEQESGAKLTIGDGCVWLRGSSFEIQEAQRKISSCFAECDVGSEISTTGASASKMDSQTEPAGDTPAAGKSKGREAYKKGK